MIVKDYEALMEKYKYVDLRGYKPIRQKIVTDNQVNSTVIISEKLMYSLADIIQNDKYKNYYMSVGKKMMNGQFGLK